jgi:hypothetical protein
MSFEQTSTSYTTSSREEIIKSGGIIYDPSAMVDDEAPLKLPNVHEIVSKIETVLEYMCTDEMVKLKENDSGEYGAHMENKFPAFSSKHFSMFQQIISGEDLTMLFKMLEALEKLSSGKTDFETVQSELKENLNKNFVTKVKK